MQIPVYRIVVCPCCVFFRIWKYVWSRSFELKSVIRRLDSGQKSSH